MILKASDLRLGNIVLYNDMMLRVTEILSPKPRKDKRFDGIHVVELLCDGLISIPISEVSPIALTSEILLKIGFEYRGHTNQYGDDVEWFYMENKKSYWALDINYQPIDYGVQMLQYELEYVHQLQNFFFTIEGKELEITL